MNIHDSKLPQAIYDYLRGSVDWADVYAMARNNSSGALYVVGGRVYRAALELIHGIRAGPRYCDWDFFVEGELCATWRAATPQGWVCSRGSYKSQHSLRFSRRHGGFQRGAITALMPPATQDKVDLISSKDFGDPGGTILDYFDAVPLKIQAIALDIPNRKLFGPGLVDIGACQVTPNNTKAVRNFPSYIAMKAESLRIPIGGDAERKTPCDCWGKDIIALMNNGCQRKDIHK